MIIINCCTGDTSPVTGIISGSIFGIVLIVIIIGIIILTVIMCIQVTPNKLRVSDICMHNSYVYYRQKSAFVPILGDDRHKHTANCFRHTY